MNILQFVESRINLLIGRFNWLTCIYQYKRDEQIHYVKVTPSDTHRNNQDYNKLLADIYLDFIKYFPGERICFITDGSPITLEAPDYLVTGNNLTIPSSAQTINLSKLDIHLFDVYEPILKGVSFFSQVDKMTTTTVIESVTLDDNFFAQLPVTSSQEQLKLINITIANAA